MKNGKGTFLLVCWLFAILSHHVYAQDQDIEGSKDHPMISRYAGSVIIGYQGTAFDEYQLPIAKAHGKGFDEVLKIEGNVTRILYSAPEGRTSIEVYRNYEKALKNAGFQSLFECAGDDCGWMYKYSVGYAGHPPLVGYSLEGDNLRFMAAKLSRPEGDVYISLAVLEASMVKKGFTFAHLDIIEIEPMEEDLVHVNAEAMNEGIVTEGHIAIYGIYFDTDKADIKPESEGTLKEIAKLLNQNPDLKVYIVGHTDNVGTLEYNMNLSMRRADSVVNALTSDYGISVDRLKAGGVGPLAPVAPNTTKDGRAKNRRVELVQN